MPTAFPWDNRILPMAHVERVWHKVYPVLPAWVHDATTIYAVYILVAALLAAFLICLYKTVELAAIALLSGTTHVKGFTAMILWDVLLAYPIWFIWTA